MCYIFGGLRLLISRPKLWWYSHWCAPGRKSVKISRKPMWRLTSYSNSVMRIRGMTASIALFTGRRCYWFVWRDFQSTIFISDPFQMATFQFALHIFQSAA